MYKKKTIYWYTQNNYMILMIKSNKKNKFVDEL